MIYKIRIILDAEEDIFRDIELEDNSTLEEFHNAITQAFGFGGSEMASFYTCDEEWNQDEEIALFDMSESGSDVRLMNETILDDVITEQNPKMIYVYDFFSMWTFFVELADIVPKENGRTYPNLLFSFGELPDSPPEKKFESKPSIDFDDSLDSYDDLDFDENWN
ncbi:plasmid pRiA4b ORF-3 family protein [Flagellimonas hymeniacidonis]|uniref:Plasmid pRiA4b ORF-3 family protein n=1 Tax=Flagellimonas hymeniacidonis TaxID=2603628 RepID=A0A5C8V2U7_9FLAO|nr:plasmid pRiA4b ORF-3 family protein [Flagellimonas hymeniacidonis]TXN35088.1 plasmid pRiA4b ORF-3 family protein [Flagellimonas hymeniacidonis]